ncbi:T9SS type A sorting domain-containing protein [Empedobacter brevis]|uniref:Secretion system C-terminal sorting domain-containing protein n=1 Tax=Empedobacter brevis NBRC 14943 = ATCC 43319 TaxID=1218108 RepID=A0A511NJ96_9FLAO|nr:T9SS type A sorting domain-containing protein [Empedobacter brevis]GEM52882.1 hypothetical protein EB1_26720 [Empedobacter brevis NBRC 14943 = ATCC 43319]
MKKRYLLLISLVSSMTLNAQQAGNNIGDNGQVEFIYQNQKVNYTTVRAADGNEWLQQNLGSEQVAKAIGDEKAFGHYFQWGRWDDGHQLIDSEVSEIYPTPNNPKGIIDGSPLFFINGGSPWQANYTGWFANPLQDDSWTAKDKTEITPNNGIDPCKAIGNEWEIPSELDWDNVMRKENIFPAPDKETVGMQRAFNSNLKIAGAGARKDNSWSFVGNRAYIWTKSPSTNPNFYRYVYLGTSTFSTTGFGGDAKSHGYSIRCVNKSSKLNTIDTEKDVNNIKAVVDQNNLKLFSPKKIQDVRIYNLAGQLVLTAKQHIVSLSNLNTGVVYLVQIKTIDGKEKSLKIVKK